MQRPFLLLLLIYLLTYPVCHAQETMTPELLWQLGRVNGIDLSKDGQYALYSVSTYDIKENTGAAKIYKIPLAGGLPQEVTHPDSLLFKDKISPDSTYELTHQAVKLRRVAGKDFYPLLDKSTVYIYDSLNYRHWDTWKDGAFEHVLLLTLHHDRPADTTDLMPGEPYDCPTQSGGSPSDYIWSKDGRQVVYVCKKKYGTAYAISTNTDLYAYDIATRRTTNLTAGMNGYDTDPSYSVHNVLAWLSMKREGYESDKQDIYVYNGITKINLTAQRDDIQVSAYQWSNDGRKIYFLAATNGTEQLFEVSYPGRTKMLPVIRQITRGDFDIASIVGQRGDTLVVSRMDMNHAPELYTVHLNDGHMQQLTHVNDAVYASIATCRTERRFVTTTDSKKMLVWVIYPPHFDSTKKYPALLYCQGGPQVSLTQFYSFRWNFQLMASEGYIVIAPSRRGMPGFGTKWNEAISKNWGGQAIMDYLSAVDTISKAPYIDSKRLGCVGASYGGYSVYYLAGIHHHRFKTFIAHDGVFDMKSMYGTTDELWFTNWENGGPYWEKNNLAAQRSYSLFSPSTRVNRWDTPILIIEGGRDFRVPLEQAQQAFQAAQLRGIKSRFLYFPDENHWILKPQNALVWQHEFFNWLEETLK